MNVNLSCTALALLASAHCLPTETAEEIRHVRLNLIAFEYARNLIASGHVIRDTKGRWHIDQPSMEKENEFLREKGFAEYAAWNLGIDGRHPEKTKARYKFPFGDFVNVHRCGLLAVKARAGEYGYSDIEAAADKLLSEIDLKHPRQ